MKLYSRLVTQRWPYTKELLAIIDSIKHPKHSLTISILFILPTIIKNKETKAISLINLWLDVCKVIKKSKLYIYAWLVLQPNNNASAEKKVLVVSKDISSG